MIEDTEDEKPKTVRDKPAQGGHLAAGKSFLGKATDAATAIADALRPKLGTMDKRRAKTYKLGVAEAPPLNWIPAKKVKPK